MAANPDRLSDDEVRMLCDQIAIRKKMSKDGGTEVTLCVDETLGSLAERALYSRSHVVQRHLQARQEQFPRMRTFIYGHTHQYEKPWPASLNYGIAVSVVNTGAFQRLINEAGFLRRLAGRTPQEGLRTMTSDELPACYTAVVVPSDETGWAAPELIAWHMEEDGVGAITDVEGSICQ